MAVMITAVKFYDVYDVVNKRRPVRVFQSPAYESTNPFAKQVALEALDKMFRKHGRPEKYEIIAKYEFPFYLPHGVQLKRTKGWKLPENTVVVSRPGKWGNPFKVGRDADNPKMAVMMYEHWLDTTIKGRQIAGQARRILCGKNLACWCPLGSPCHRDILLNRANGFGTTKGTE